jgi:hypothetical protein
VGGDLHQHVEAGESDYRTTNKRPISVAHDDFSVMGDGYRATSGPSAWK